MELVPYLNFDGTCRTAFDFYQRVLGGEIVMMTSFKESPMSDQIPAEFGDRIMHARLVTNGTTLMGSDSQPGSHAKPQGFGISLNVVEPTEADRIFGALEDGGKVEMPLQETYWAKRFGMVVDRYDILWMVNCEAPAA